MAKRTSEAALWLTLALVLAILSGARFGWLGLLFGCLIVIGTVTYFNRATPNPEIESLRASLRVARDDIEQVIGEYDELLSGTSTDAIADRTLNYPALVSNDFAHPDIEDFHLRLGSSRRFLSRVDAHLVSDDLDRHALEKMINIADQRAADLAESWTAARRAAREAGPQ